MNKNDLIAIIAEKTQMTKADCQRVIEATIDITRDCVKRGEDVRLVGFGTFVKSKRSSRRARNPQTGRDMQIPEHYVPRFRAGKEFRDQIS